MDILGLIDAYCFAVNGNNGESSEYEIQKAQDYYLERLGDI